MSVELLTEHHLEFLSLKGGCTGSSESTLAKIPHCWKSRVTVHIDEQAEGGRTEETMQAKEKWVEVVKNDEVSSVWVQGPTKLI